MATLDRADARAAGAYPGDALLLDGLRGILTSKRRRPTRIAARRRSSPDEATRGTWEVVTIATERSGDVTVFCKYGNAHATDSGEHHGGLAREIRTYRDLLTAIQLRTPILYGSTEDDGEGRSWLVIEHLAGFDQLKYTANAHTINLAAGWLGAFHRVTEEHSLADRAAAFPRRGRDYFASWAQRTAEFGAPLTRTYPWLRDVCGAAVQALERLDDPAAPVLHGEFYTSNIMCRGRTICPVDWESTSTGPGVLDLVMLCEGWPVAVTRGATGAYSAARWAGDPPWDLAQQLDLAWLFLPLRWLGDRPEWTLHPTVAWRFDALLVAAQRLGLA